MEQRDAASETPSESVDQEGDDETVLPFVERHFWSLLVGGVLLATTASVGVVYTQYSRVDQALKSVPYVNRAGQLVEAVPFAGRVIGSIPYVGSSVDSLTGASNEPREFGSFTRMKGLVINPAGSKGQHYLAVSLAFESKSQSVVQELKSKKVVVRDAVLTLLSERTVDELSNPNRRDELKKVLRTKTNSFLSNGKVDRLYFTEFVLQ